jgi:hypothetical protein
MKKNRNLCSLITAGATAIRSRSSAINRRFTVASHAENRDAYAFFNLPTGPELFDEVESHLPEHRERLFPPTETLPMYLIRL